MNKRHPNKRNISFWVSKEFKKAIQKASQQKGYSVSRFCELWIRKGLKACKVKIEE